eukprot:6975433-Pyramimonas_sp.AAC.1
MRRRVDNADGSMGRDFDSVSGPASEPANPLFEAARRAGTSGPGMDLIACREASLVVKPHESLVGFFSESTFHKP